MQHFSVHLFLSSKASSATSAMVDFRSFNPARAHPRSPDPCRGEQLEHSMRPGELHRWVPTKTYKVPIRGLEVYYKHIQAIQETIQLLKVLEKRENMSHV